MPRTAITAVAADTTGLVAAATVAFTAADVANGNSTPHTGKQEIWVHNSNAASPLVSHKVTLYSKFGSQEFTVAGSSYAVLRSITSTGYKQSDDNIWFNGDHADLLFAVVNQP